MELGTLDTIRPFIAFSEEDDDLDKEKEVDSDDDDIDDDFDDDDDKENVDDGFSIIEGDEVVE